MFVYEFTYLIPGEKGEFFNIPGCILVRSIKPELVEFIGAGLFRIKPDIAAFGLPEFSAVSFCNKRAGEGIGFTSQFAAY
jgi:hypothetical protein